MNFGIKLRLAALGLATALMGALIVLVTLYSQRQGTELRTRLNDLESQSFGIAEQFKDALRDVNDKMIRYRTVPRPRIGRNSSMPATNWIFGLTLKNPN